MTQTLVGTLPVLLTPFTDEEKIDFDSLENLTAWTLQRQVGGLVLFGLGGEGYKLTDEERMSILKVVSVVNNGAVPLIVAIDQPSSSAAVSLAAQVADAGASAVMCRGAAGIRPSDSGVVNYFSEIAAAIPVPVVIQDLPMPSGWGMSAELLSNICNSSGISHVKVESAPTPEKMSSIQRLSNRPLSLFGGLGGRYYFEELNRGAVGVMPGCLFTDIFTKIRDKYISKDLSSASEIFYHNLPLMVFGEGVDMLVSLHKRTLHKIGVIASPVSRGPCAGADSQTGQSWDALVAKILGW